MYLQLKVHQHTNRHVDDVWKTTKSFKAFDLQTKNLSTSFTHAGREMWLKTPKKSK